MPLCVHVYECARAARRRNEIGFLRVSTGDVGRKRAWQTRAEMKFRSSKTFPNRLPTSTITTHSLQSIIIHMVDLSADHSYGLSHVHIHKQNDRPAVLNSKCASGDGCCPVAIVFPTGDRCDAHSGNRMTLSCDSFYRVELREYLRADSPWFANGYSLSCPSPQLSTSPLSIIYLFIHLEASFI